MAIKKFNAVAGFSVGDDVVIEVIDNVANVNANNLSVTGESQLGSVANVKITGGSANYILKTDGTGNLVWQDPGSSGVAGSNTQIQFNNSGSFGTDANFTYNSSTDTLGVKNVSMEATGTLSGGNLVSAGYLTGTLTTASQPNITSVGTLSSLTVGPNSSIILSGTNGYLKTNTIQGIDGTNGITMYYGNVPGAVGVATDLTVGTSSAGNLTVNGTIAGNLVTAPQPNITTVGTLSNLTSNGNVNFTNASNVSLGSIANVHISGGAAGYVLKTDGAGNLSWGIDTTAAGGSNTQVQFNDGGSLSATANFTFDKTTNLLTLNGNILAGNANLGNLVTANFFTGNGIYLSSITGANVTGTVANANYAAYAATITANNQPNITALGTLSSLTVSGNLTSGNANLGNLATASYFSGNGIYLSSITGANVTGTVANANYAAYAGNVVNANQPNITGVGTLNGLTVSGNITSGNAVLGNLVTANYITSVLTSSSASQPNITALGTLSNLTSNGTVNFANASNVNLGSNANVHISGGAAGYVLKTDGAGNLSWGIDTTAAGGSNTQVQYNDNASLAGSANFTFNNTTNTLSVTNIVANGAGITYITGANVNGQVANALVAGTVYTAAQPNITSVGTLTGLTVSGTTTLTGNVTIDGTLANLSVSNLSVQDNVIDLSAETTGTPSNNAGLRVIRGDELSVQLRWTESALAWQFTNDGVNYLSIVGKDSAGNTNLGNLAVANYFSGSGNLLSNIQGANVSGAVTTANYAAYAGNITVAAQPNITSLGTLTTLVVTGNVTSGNANLGNAATANYFIGNGSLLTGIVAAATASNVSNGTSNVNIPTANGNITVGVSGTANVAVFTSTGINVSGYVNATGNLTAANATLGNLVTANYFSGNGSLLTSINGSNVTGQVANALVAGTVYTNAQPNITSVGTLSSLTVSGVSTLGAIGNVKITGGTAGYTIVTDGTGNLSWTPVSSSGTGFTNVTKNTFTGNGVQTVFNLTGTPASADAVQVNINGLIQLETSYSISGSTVVFTTAPLNGQLIEVTIYGVVAVTSNSGEVLFSSGGNLAGSNSFTFNSTTNTLSVTNLTASSNVSAGNIKTDNILYANGSPYVFTTSPAGSNTQIQFNDNGVFGATANLTFNKSTNTLSTYNVVASNLMTVTNGTVILGTGTIAVSAGAAGIFATGVSNINLGLAANVTIGSTTGNVNIQGNLNVGNISTITNLKVNDLYSNRTPITVTTGTVVDSFAVNKYRSAKYTMRVNSDDGYQAVEVLLIHDNSTSYVTIYGSLSTIGTDIIALTTDINSGNVRLLATTGSANTSVNILGTYISD